MWLFREAPCAALLATFLTCTSAAVITQTSNLLLTNPDPSNQFPPNTSLPANQTISTPPNILPPSPYIYPIPTAPSTTVTFSAYTRPMRELSALECILPATEDVQSALEAAVRDGRDHDPVMRQRYLRIDAEHALLLVASVEGRLGWVTCAQTLKALTGFLYRWEFVGVTFVVEVEGVRVAVGVLAGR